MDHECIRFVATVGLFTDCALYSREFVCGADGESKLMSHVPWNNPHIRAFDKKGASLFRKLCSICTLPEEDFNWDLIFAFF